VHKVSVSAFCRKSNKNQYPCQSLNYNNSNVFIFGVLVAMCILYSAAMVILDRL